MDTPGRSNAHIRTDSVPTALIEGETAEYQFWSVNPSTGAITGSNTVPASGGYIEAEVDGRKITLTLNNVQVNPGVPFAPDMGNADVKLRLVGENILNSAENWPAIYVTSDSTQAGESNLTITGDGSLTCLGEGSVNDSTANGYVGAAVYAQHDLAVNGSLSATGGEASGEEASSAGIYFNYTDTDKTAAGFTVGETGVVTANGGSVGDSSAGVYYDGPATINGELTADGGEADYIYSAYFDGLTVSGKLSAKAVGKAEAAFALVSEEIISVEDGAHVIADASGAEADVKVALVAPGGLTLPNEYRWRTSADGEFTLYSVEPYVYEFDETDLPGSDIYVEIAPVEVPATGVTLSESSLVLDVGETAQLTAAVVPEGTTDELVWSSSNPDVATVDENGLVTAVGPGRTVISAAAGSVSAECSVTVRGGSVDVGPTYEIELDEGIVGGEIKTSLTNASAGSTIRVTATPDAGYELAYITVDGERIPGTSFTMPAHDVTVSAVFTRGEGFADVAPGSWYYDAVEFVRARGLMDGVSETEFNPDGTMTRAMVWAILGRLDGEEISGSGWLEAARAWALESGVSDGTEPNAAVTREQLVTMLYRFAGESATAADLNGYADGGEVSDWARDAFAWAIEHMIITGVDDDTLAPQSTATRAQCAAILMRFTQI